MAGSLADAFQGGLSLRPSPHSAARTHTRADDWTHRLSVEPKAVVTVRRYL